MSELDPPAIADYALIGNCRTAALVSNRGSIDWGCFPRFDSPSYFARILDREGGHFSVSPLASFQSRQSYLEGTNVVVTRFVTRTGVSELSDLMPVRASGSVGEALWPDEEILRVLEMKDGAEDFSVELLLRGDYGRKAISFQKLGTWGIRGVDGRKTFFLQGSPGKLSFTLRESSLGTWAESRFHLRAGERVVLSLSYADTAPAVIPSVEGSDQRLDSTIRYWRDWSSRLVWNGPYRELIQRSALALKLCCFAPSGAIIAAPTTSLPEWVGGSRNWDYRYCWLRDASFTTRALMRLGCIDEAKAYLNWLLHSTRLTRPRLQVLYSVYGESAIREETLGELSGYRDSKPVRLGNRASTQFQLDLYGEVIDSLYSLAEHLRPIDRETRKMVIGLGRAVAELWRETDQGIWEPRTGAKNHVHSKLMSWVAMDRLAKLSRQFAWNLPYPAERIAEEIRAWIEEQGFHPELRSYTGAAGETNLDASVLVMPLVGYCSATSLRFQSTLDAVVRQLSRGDLIYRYLPGSDGLPEPEGSFVICGFWLAEACARAGDLDQARRWFDAVVSRLPPSGLASEEVDPESGEWLGNHPQAFSHVGLINSAMAIGELQIGLEGRISA